MTLLCSPRLSILVALLALAAGCGLGGPTSEPPAHEGVLGGGGSPAGEPSSQGANGGAAGEEPDERGDADRDSPRPGALDAGPPQVFDASAGPIVPSQDGSAGELDDSRAEAGADAAGSEADAGAVEAGATSYNPADGSADAGNEAGAGPDTDDCAADPVCRELSFGPSSCVPACASR